MSVASDIYDGILTKMATLFPTHTVIPNPYDLGANSDRVLSKSYGVAWSAAENSLGSISCQYSISRSIIISIVRQTFAKETQVKDDAVKALLDDQQILYDEVFKNENFGLTDASKFNYVSDPGIENLRGIEELRYIKIDHLFELEYFRNIP